VSSSRREFRKRSAVSSAASQSRHSKSPGVDHGQEKQPDADDIGFFWRIVNWFGSLFSGENNSSLSSMFHTWMSGKDKDNPPEGSGNQAAVLSLIPNGWGFLLAILAGVVTFAILLVATVSTGGVASPVAAAVIHFFISATITSFTAAQFWAAFLGFLTLTALAISGITRGVLALFNVDDRQKLMDFRREHPDIANTLLLFSALLLPLTICLAASGVSLVGLLATHVMHFLAPLSVAISKMGFGLAAIIESSLWAASLTVLPMLVIELVAKLGGWVKRKFFNAAAPRGPEEASDSSNDSSDSDESPRPPGSRSSVRYVQRQGVEVDRNAQVQLGVVAGSTPGSEAPGASPAAGGVAEVRREADSGSPEKTPPSAPRSGGIAVVASPLSSSGKKKKPEGKITSEQLKTKAKKLKVAAKEIEVKEKQERKVNKERKHADHKVQKIEKREEKETRKRTDSKGQQDGKGVTAEKDSDENSSGVSSRRSPANQDLSRPRKGSRAKRFMRSLTGGKKSPGAADESPRRGPRRESPRGESPRRESPRRESSRGESPRRSRKLSFSAIVSPRKSSKPKCRENCFVYRSKERPTDTQLANVQQTTFFIYGERDSAGSYSCIIAAPSEKIFFGEINVAKLLAAINKVFIDELKLNGSCPLKEEEGVRLRNVVMRRRGGRAQRSSKPTCEGKCFVCRLEKGPDKGELAQVKKGQTIFFIYGKKDSHNRYRCVIATPLPKEAFSGAIEESEITVAIDKTSVEQLELRLPYSVREGEGVVLRDAVEVKRKKRRLTPSRRRKQSKPKVSKEGAICVLKEKTDKSQLSNLREESKTTFFIYKAENFVRRKNEACKCIIFRPFSREPILKDIKMGAIWLAVGDDFAGNLEKNKPSDLSEGQCKKLWVALGVGKHERRALAVTTKPSFRSRSHSITSGAVPGFINQSVFRQTEQTVSESEYESEYESDSETSFTEYSEYRSPIRGYQSPIREEQPPIREEEEEGESFSFNQPRLGPPEEESEPVDGRPGSVEEKNDPSPPSFGK